MIAIEIQLICFSYIYAWAIFIDKNLYHQHHGAQSQSSDVGANIGKHTHTHSLIHTFVFISTFYDETLWHININSFSLWHIETNPFIFSIFRTPHTRAVSLYDINLKNTKRAGWRLHILRHKNFGKNCSVAAVTVSIQRIFRAKNGQQW